MVRRLRLLCLLALVALVTATGGCVRKPVVELHGAWPKVPTPQGVGMDLFLKINNDPTIHLLVTNRNPVAIDANFGSLIG